MDQPHPRRPFRPLNGGQIPIMASPPAKAFTFERHEDCYKESIYIYPPSTGIKKQRDSRLHHKREHTATQKERTSKRREKRASSRHRPVHPGEEEEGEEECSPPSPPVPREQESEIEREDFIQGREGIFSSCSSPFFFSPFFSFSFFPFHLLCKGRSNM